MKKLTVKDKKNMAIAVYQEIQRSEDSKYDHRLHGVLMAIKLFFGYGTGYGTYWNVISSPGELEWKTIA